MCFSHYRKYFFLQKFVEKMASVLQVPTTPLDHNLEAVMPGVHQRFNAIQSSLATLENRVVQMSEVGDERWEKMMSGTNGALATALRGIADTIEGGGSGDDVTPADSGESFCSPNCQQLESEDPPLEESEEFLLARARNFSPRVKHNNLRSVWAQWKGLEPFLDQPIVGGVERCDELFGSKWRQHFCQSEVRRFSRLKLVATGMCNVFQTVHEAAEEGRIAKTVDDAFEELELVFVEKKTSLQHMVTWLQESGFLEKKRPRGTKRSASNAQL